MVITDCVKIRTRNIWTLFLTENEYIQFVVVRGTESISEGNRKMCKISTKLRVRTTKRSNECHSAVLIVL